MKFASLSALAISMATTASAQNMGFAGRIGNKASFDKFEAMSDTERALEVTKKLWPECLSGKLNDAHECEKHIDAELAAMNLSFPVPTIILYSRHPDSPTAHYWVIPIDDNGMCTGKYGDGRLFYDWEWCVDKEEPLTDPKAIESSKVVPASKWSQKIASNKNLECVDLDGDGDLEVFNVKAGKEVGGDFELACNSQEGVDKFNAAKAAGPVVKQGCTKIPPVDCSGLSGVAACAMIKEMVPYPNNKGKNMECFIEFRPDSPKHEQIQRDLIAIGDPKQDRVAIYAKFETNKVMKTPVMVGPNAVLGAV